MPNITVQDTFSALAARMMGKFGTDASLSRVIESYDPAIDETTTTVATSTILVVFEDVEVEDKGGVQTKQTVIKSNSPLALNDRITLAGKTYVVESVKNTAPTGTALFWTAVVR